MLPEAVREFFLLASAEQDAQRLDTSRRNLATTYLRAADARLAFAPFLVDPRTSIAGVVQLREGVALLVRAYVAAHDAHADAATVNRLHPADELRGLFEASLSPPGDWEIALACLTTDDCLFVDRLDDGARRRVGLALQAIASWLRRRIEVRSVTHVRATRRGRWAALALVVVYATCTIVARLAHPNLALHRDVTQSSAWPGSAPSSALVDGDTAGDVGPERPHCNLVHTNHEPSPWMKIDLGAVTRLHEVRVYNRNEHNLDASLPLVLELSADGRTFHEAARRTTHFGATSFDPPWSADVRGQEARFVRVSGHDYLALAEVEVY